MEELDPSVAVPLLFIADSHLRHRREFRRFFSSSGFRVLVGGNGLECLAELGAMETDVLVIALEIPWGDGDGVIARLNDGRSVRRKPLIFVIGDAPADTLSTRTGVAPCNCFSTPLFRFSKRRELANRAGRAPASVWPQVFRGR